MRNEISIKDYEADCKPMHFKKRAEKIFADFANKKDAINFVDKILEYVEVAFKDDIAKNRYIYWCQVRRTIDEDLITDY